MTSFPTVRLRRLRRSPGMRALVRETRLSADRFVTGFFVKHGKGVREEISSLPGVFRLSPDEAVAEAQELATLGVHAAILFGIRIARTTPGRRRGTTRRPCRRPSAG